MLYDAEVCLGFTRRGEKRVDLFIIGFLASALLIWRLVVYMLDVDCLIDVLVFLTMYKQC